MQEEETKAAVRFLALAAGISLQEERLAAMALALDGLREAQEKLARLELGEATPAFRFQPPAERS